jgi:hypothetical protein
VYDTDTAIKEVLVPQFRIFILSALTCTAAGAAATPVNITVKPDLVREHFAGPGFQCEMFLDSLPKEYVDQDRLDHN